MDDSDEEDSFREGNRSDCDLSLKNDFQKRHYVVERSTLSPASSPSNELKNSELRNWSMFPTKSGKFCLILDEIQKRNF